MFYRNLVLAAAATGALAENAQPREVYEKLFFDWMVRHEQKFSSGAEFIKRLAIFAVNHDIIEAHNSQEGITYTMGHNQYSAMTLEEFHDHVKIGGTRPGNLRKNPTGPKHVATEGASLAESVDWVSAGAVTPVKNQGSCGSCWSFSATGALEGAYQIKNKELLSFSEQELVSCDTTDGGCNGGWMDDAFAWVNSNGGLCTEGDYPYTSGGGSTASCDLSSCSNVAMSPSYTDVTEGSVNDLMSAVAQQPVSIAIQANQLAFQLYSSGVLTGKCGQNLDHGVLAVGYGTYTDGTDYWKVKNSWGDSWGMDGYILIERSDADLCGVLDAASYPNL